jgi:lipid-binding SYLF domain-containing protein
MCCALRSRLTAIAALLLGACAAGPTTPRAKQANIADAQSRVDRAVAVVGQLRQSPGMDALLHQAKGILVVPDSDAAGGVGVMAEQTRGGHWSNPAFFTVGGVSSGLQAGDETGAVVYVLMSGRAIAPFENRTSKFTLAAGAGLTVSDFSGAARSAAGHLQSDVVVWTADKRRSAGDGFGVTEVVANSALDATYYRALVSPRQILIGAVHNAQAEEFDRALTMQVAAE